MTDSSRTVSRKRSERQRWVRIRGFRFRDENVPVYAAREFEQLYAVVNAFQTVGRVVRLCAEAGALVLRARR